MLPCKGRFGSSTVIHRTDPRGGIGGGGGHLLHVAGAFDLHHPLDGDRHVLHHYLVDRAPGVGAETWDHMNPWGKSCALNPELEIVMENCCQKYVE